VQSEANKREGGGGVFFHRISQKQVHLEVKRRTESFRKGIYTNWEKGEEEEFEGNKKKRKEGRKSSNSSVLGHIKS